MPEAVRCAICGKVVEYGEQVMQVNSGRLTEGARDIKKTWGITHRSCFNKALPSPKAAIDEIKKLVKQAAA
jgi:hypothetical protein